MLQLCEQHQVEVVFHLAMLTDSPTHGFEINGNTFPVVDPVWNHFRSLRNLKRLFESDRFHFFGEPFTHQGRADYFGNAIEQLKALNARKLVLLDPDTGLAPNSANEKHVRVEECQGVWTNLTSGDARSPRFVGRYVCTNTSIRYRPLHGCDGESSFQCPAQTHLLEVLMSLGF